MAETIIYYDKSAVFDSSYPNSTFDAPVNFTNYYDISQYLVIGPSVIPDSIKYKRVLESFVYLYSPGFSEPLFDDDNIRVTSLKKQFEESKATFDNVSLNMSDSTTTRVYKNELPKYIATRLTTLKSSMEAACFGVCVSACFATYIQTTKGSNKPYVKVITEDNNSGLLISPLSPGFPNSGYAYDVNRSGPTEFSWTEASPTDTIAEIKKVSGTLQWRENEQGTIHEIDVSNVTSVTVPAGTFLSEKIQWRIVIVANSGVTTETQWYEMKVSQPNIFRGSPSSGFVPKYQDSIFTWDLASLSPYGVISIPQKNGIFRYRENESAAISEISVGSDKSITVPAGTFLTDSIQWQSQGETEDGAVCTSFWYSITTEEPLSSASIVSPKNTVIDGAAVQTFRWDHLISTGTAPTAFDLQANVDDQGWKDVVSQETSNTYVNIDPYTFPAGELYWRVRTYNTDKRVGDWSAEEKVIVLSAPDTPKIAIVRSAPKFSIRWDQTGQEAFEIAIDGKRIARKFGRESNYTHSDYLDPGSYVVSVRIQNRFMLWSDWSSADLVISNVESAPISLSLSANGSLSWGSSERFDGYIIYRNGEKIAKTSGNTYTDQFAIGKSSYRVRGINETTGFFTMSNVVDTVVNVPFLMIADVNDPVWQPLKYATGVIRSSSFEGAPSVTYLHYVGNELPHAEIGEAVSKTYQLNTAFKASDLAAAQAFEGLLGKLVCVKEPGGERYVGVLDNISKETNRFYREYIASITLVHWEEGVT